MKQLIAIYLILLLGSLYYLLTDRFEAEQIQELEANPGLLEVEPESLSGRPG